MKSNSDHRSVSRFSMGVPVSAMRERALRRLMALVCLVSGFLMACASSRITRRHAILAQPRQAYQPNRSW